LLGQLVSQFLLGGGAGHQYAGGDGDDQRGDLRNQAVADGQEREALQRLTDGHPLLHDADGKAAQHVDERDQDGGNGVAAHEFAGPVHGPVKVRFLFDGPAAGAGLLFVDDAGVKLGVDGHLLAGHGVQGEAGRHFGDTPGALGDDDEIDQDQNQEDDQADDVIAVDDVIAERFDDMPGITIQQDQPGRGNVERKPVKRDKEQQGREPGEFGRFLDVKDGEQNEQRKRDADGQKAVQQHRIHGEDHQQDRPEQSANEKDIAVPEKAGHV
jgi:hypothetical protein